MALAAIANHGTMATGIHAAARVERETIMRSAAIAAFVVLGWAGAHGAVAQTLNPDIITRELRLSDRADGPVDSLRLNLSRAGFEGGDIDFTLVRRWPEAVSFDAGALDFDLVPHAGFGMSSRGGQAEGGATLTVSPKTRGERALERLADMGLKDGATLGDAGRWYLFAAASGRAVGLNMTHGEHGWGRGDWTTDDTGALVGDAQIGVGWRKGDLQSSFGVIHREVKGRHMIFGQLTRDDTVAAFTFSLKPRR